MPTLSRGQIFKVQDAEDSLSEVEIIFDGHVSGDLLAPATASLTLFYRPPELVLDQLRPQLMASY